MPIANPEITASIRAAGVTAGLTAEKLLFVAQGGTSATELRTNVVDGSFYDPFSPLAHAIDRARSVNPSTQFDVIQVPDNGGGVASTGDITVIPGPVAGADGTIIIIVGSEKDNKYTASVLDGDSVANIGDAIEAVINADNTCPVTAVHNGAGINVLTAKIAGPIGNDTGLSVVSDVQDITMSIGGMTGGNTAPVVTTVFDLIGENRYQGIVWQFDDDTDTIIDFLDARFNVQNNILDGVGFVGKTDTFANHLSTLGALNSPSLSYIADQTSLNTSTVTPYDGPAILEIPFVKAAEFASIRALRRTEGAILGNLVIARSPRDAIGGPSSNSKPYFNTPLPSLFVPRQIEFSFTENEVSQLIAAGGWVMDGNRANNQVISGPVVTTSKTNASGTPDPTFTFLNYVDTSSASREFIVNNTRDKYAQYRAASGALINGRDSANEASITAFVIELNGLLGDDGLVNSGVGTLDGETVDFDKAFKESLTVSLNPVTGKFTVALKLFIVTQLRAVNYDLAVAFEV